MRDENTISNEGQQAAPMPPATQPMPEPSGSPPIGASAWNQAPGATENAAPGAVEGPVSGVGPATAPAPNPMQSLGDTQPGAAPVFGAPKKKKGLIAGIIIANLTLGPVDSVLTLLYWIALISAAGILGNFVGYWGGTYFGHRLLKMNDNWLFKKEYIFRAQEFYEKRGGAAIILARFLPVVRTFAPIVAGIVEMDIRKFALYNVIGGVLWVGSLATLGYLLGENEWVQRNLEYVILGIVVAATAPVLVKMITGKGKKETATAAEEREVVEEEC